MNIFGSKKRAGQANAKKTSFISWFEIPASDFYRATKFYYKTFGFNINELELNGAMHGIFDDAKLNVRGAIIDQQENFKAGGVVLFFNAMPSISELEKKIIANGGKILVSKTLIKNVDSSGKSVIPINFIDGTKQGYFAYFEDTEGNKMGLFGSS